MNGTEVDEENYSEPIYDLRFNINYYGADYPVDSLVKRMEYEEFIIPHFQREYVWNVREASRFIESLLLGLPVPSLFFAKDKFTNKLIVIDGQQRLRTLQYFYRGEFANGKPFTLKNISIQFEGLTYQTMSSEDRLNLDNTIIHCIIIAENEDSNRIFYLFERLNTTGTPLNSQEIRNALYHGPLISFLKDLATTDLWKRLYRKADRRFESEELILRFFALHFDLEEYSGNLNQFLNDFLLKNRNFDHSPPEKFEKIFLRTFETIYENIGSDAFYYENKFNRALFETISLTVSNNIDRAEGELLRRFYEDLISNKDFWKMTRSSTTSVRNLRTRLQLADEILDRIR